jgi:hypothetical protein
LHSPDEEECQAREKEEEKVEEHEKVEKKKEKEVDVILRQDAYIIERMRLRRSPRGGGADEKEEGEGGKIRRGEGKRRRKD